MVWSGGDFGCFFRQGKFGRGIKVYGDEVYLIIFYFLIYFIIEIVNVFFKKCI